MLIKASITIICLSFVGASKPVTFPFSKEKGSYSLHSNCANYHNEKNKKFLSASEKSIKPCKKATSAEKSSRPHSDFLGVFLNPKNWSVSMQNSQWKILPGLAVSSKANTRKVVPLLRFSYIF